MKKVWQVAAREFIATVSNRAFVIGLLIMPAIFALFGLIGPALFNFQNFKVEGELRSSIRPAASCPDIRAA